MARFSLAGLVAKSSDCNLHSVIRAPENLLASLFPCTQALDQSPYILVDFRQSLAGSGEVYSCCWAGLPLSASRS